MGNWLNQHIDTLVTVILALFSCFFSFVLVIALLILKHRERIKGIETKLAEIYRRLQELEQQVKPSPQTSDLKNFKEFITLVKELKQTIDKLNPPPNAPESKTLYSHNGPKSLTEIPIEEIKVSHKSKNRPMRTKKKSKKSK